MSEISSHAVPSKERLSGDGYHFLILDLDETVLRGKFQTPEEIKTVVKTLNEFFRFNRILPIINTQKPAIFFEKESPIEDAQKYREFLDLQWNLDGETIPAPFILNEFGAYARIPRADGTMELINNPLFENFIGANDSLNSSPRARLIDYLQERYVDKGFGHFEEGRIAGVSIILDEKGRQKLGYGNDEMAKDAIAEACLGAEEIADVWGFVRVLTKGNDVDFELKDAVDQGKYISISFIKYLLNENPRFRDDHRFDKLRKEMEKTGSKMFGIVDDKEYAARMASRELLQEGGFAATQEEADLNLKQIISDEGGSVSQWSRALGALSAIGSEIGRKKIDEIYSDVSTFRKEFRDIKRQSRGNPCIISLGDQEKNASVVKEAYEESEIESDKFASANLELSPVNLRMLTTEISLDPRKYANSLFLLNLRSLEDRQKVRDFFTNLSSIYKERGTRARFKIVAYGRKISLNGSEPTHELTDYVRELFAKNDQVTFHEFEYTSDMSSIEAELQRQVTTYIHYVQS